MNQTSIASLLQAGAQEPRALRGMAGQPGVGPEASGSDFALLFAAMGQGAPEAAVSAQPAGTAMPAAGTAVTGTQDGIQEPAPGGVQGVPLTGVQDRLVVAIQGGAPAASETGFDDSQPAQPAALPGDGLSLPGAAPTLSSGAASTAEDELPRLGSHLPDVGAMAPWMASLQPVTLQPAPLPTPRADALPGGQAPTLVGRVGLGLARPGVDSLVGQTARLDGAAEMAMLDGTAPDAGVAAPVGRGGEMPLQAWPGTEAAQGKGGFSVTARRGAAKDVQAGVETVAARSEPPTPALHAMAAAPGAERHDALSSMVQPGMRAEAEPPALAGGSPAPEGAAAAGAPRVGEGVSTPAAGMAGLEPPSQPGLDGGMAEAAPAALAVADEQLSEQLADQVSYWVQHNTQNAEVTLDRDGLPVEVRVALTGEQAHVSLRSDQAEARQLLNSGREQLQDMLQRQGLQLAGMTVGAGAGDGAARQDGRGDGRQGAQRAGVRAVTAETAGMHRAGGVGERSVDIFV